jgi:hypothetical protein
MAEAHVMLAPERNGSRGGDEELGSRPRGCQKLGKQEEIVLDMLKDIHEKKEVGGTRVLSEIFGRESAEKVRPGEPFSSPVNCRFSRIDSHAAVPIHQLCDVGSSSTTYVHDACAWWNDLGDDVAHDAPACGKPPVLLFKFRV